MKFKRITVDLHPIIIEKLEDYAKLNDISFNSALNFLLYNLLVL